MNRNRWNIAMAGTALQLCLGTVYAWSYFQKPLVDAYHWSNTQVATAAKWFPDKKGLVTGMVIMGFGFGALLMSKVLAPFLLSVTGGDLVKVFALLGVVFTVATAGCGAVLRNPPPDFAVAGHPAGGAATAAEDGSAGRALLSWRFAMMWVIFFCNIVAGIALIGFQSPLLQDLLRRRDPALAAAALAAQGATLIAVSSLFNGAGRFFWGGLSDRIGRIQAFRIMLFSQVVVFLLLSVVGHPWIFAALVCYVLLCYGGGFGTMPSFVLDVFGTRLMPVVYGTILTAWSAAGIAGPQIVAWLRDHQGAQAAAYAFRIGAAFLAVGAVISLCLTAKPRGKE